MLINVMLIEKTFSHVKIRMIYLVSIYITIIFSLFSTKFCVSIQISFAIFNFKEKQVTPSRNSNKPFEELGKRQKFRRIANVK